MNRRNLYGLAAAVFLISAMAGACVSDDAGGDEEPDKLAASGPSVPSMKSWPNAAVAARPRGRRGRRNRRRRRHRGRGRRSARPHSDSERAG
ncbi:MAG: hypothetical protein M5R36_22400 [Deltaproteobacteria bacterium]|nr:hypothetical protein [Deltaproteobacteria bacterium]